MSEQQDIKREKIRKKIQALLAKTTENGATESEAMSALDKAKELMFQHMIHSSELTEKELKDLIIERTVELRSANTRYELPLLCKSIAKLFDAQMYYYTPSKNVVIFFGLKEDVELCEYFAIYLSNSLFKSIREYRSSKRYQELKNNYGISGTRQLIDFSKGYIERISVRLFEMYEERYNHKNKGLIIAKEQVIKEQYDLLINPTMRNVTNAKYKETYEAGASQGDKTPIIQGMNSSQEEMLKQLTTNEILQIK